MSLWQSLKIALTALKANLLRSILTMLGIIIGVASVIAMVAVGSGAQREVDRQISSLGTNMLMVSPGGGRSMGRSIGAGTTRPFSEADLAALRDKVGGVVAISGQLNGNFPVVYGNTNWQTQVSGVHAEYLSVRDWQLASGREFNAGEVRSAAKVALIGQTVMSQLFPGEEPIGATIRVKNVPMTVIGVLQTKGLAAFGRDQDDVVMVPITTARNTLVGGSEVMPNQVGQLSIEFEPGTDLAAAQEEIETLMRDRRKIRPGKEDDFDVRNLAEFMRARNETQQTLSLLLGAAAAISLLVGGIGIMNIMLVSVTERTREIGLRMAVGARGRDILWQFLVEAVTLCVLGGLMGTALGIGISAVVARAAQWPMVVSPEMVMLAMLAAGATGVFFGFFPARRAARLNPIDALRSE